MKQPKQITIVATVTATFTYDCNDVQLNDDYIEIELNQTLVSLTSDMKANMILDDPKSLAVNEVSVGVVQVIPSAFDYK